MLKRFFSVACFVSTVLLYSDCSSKPTETTTSIGTSADQNTSSAEGKVLQDSKDQRVYYIFDGKRHYVPDPATLESLGLTKQVTSASNSEINQIPSGDPLPSLSSDVIQKSSGEVYRFENGKRRYVPDSETLNSLHINKRKIQNLANPVVDALPLGEPLPHLAKAVAQP